MKRDGVSKTRINTTEYFRVYSEKEIEELLVADLRKRADALYGPAKSTVHFSTNDSISGGPRREAKVKVIVDHEPLAEPYP